MSARFHSQDVKSRVMGSGDADKSLDHLGFSFPFWKHR